MSNLDNILHNQTIGRLTNFPNDKNHFFFNQRYIDDPQRHTLSLSFKDTAKDLITETKMSRTRLPPFFSNLLPEGPMREYLATQANVHSQREFFLLSALGKDLPGALKILPAPTDWELNEPSSEYQNTILRFSLAGVQLKFSAIWGEKGLTIPVDGVGGSWIIKLPSSVYQSVPENEYVMMELARHIGIDVPETALIPIEQIHGLPKGIGNKANQAFIIKRFDRTPEGEGIHIEDFAQVFGVYPEKKYHAASYRSIAQVIWTEIGEKGIIEFVRRFVFNALIGNGDMHLKNWSLIYRDKVHPSLAPAYDFVSTIPYLPEDPLALTFVDSKAYESLSYEQFRRFATKVGVPETVVLDTARDTVQKFKRIWKSISDFPLDQEIIEVINKHLLRIPISTAADH